MKKIAILCLFVMMIAGCNSSDDNPFKGAWASSEGYIVLFEDSSWYLPQYSGGVGLKGSYTYTDNTATIIYLEISNDGVSWRPISFVESDPYTNEATISGDELTWGMTTYTRR